jgi:hypothetical protein
VLMVIVIGLNALAARIARGRRGGPTWIR